MKFLPVFEVSSRKFILWAGLLGIFILSTRFFVKFSENEPLESIWVELIFWIMIYSVMGVLLWGDRRKNKRLEVEKVEEQILTIDFHRETLRRRAIDCGFSDERQFIDYATAFIKEGITNGWLVVKYEGEDPVLTLYRPADPTLPGEDIPSLVKPKDYIM